MITQSINASIAYIHVHNIQEVLYCSPVQCNVYGHVLSLISRIQCDFMFTFGTPGVVWQKNTFLICWYFSLDDYKLL